MFITCRRGLLPHSSPLPLQPRHLTHSHTFVWYRFLPWAGPPLHSPSSYSLGYLQPLSLYLSAVPCLYYLSRGHFTAFGTLHFAVRTHSIEVDYHISFLLTSIRTISWAFEVATSLTAHLPTTACTSTLTLPLGCRGREVFSLSHCTTTGLSSLRLCSFRLYHRWALPLPSS